MALITRRCADELVGYLVDRPGLAPSLLAHLTHTCKWELRRRKRQPPILKAPRDVIPAQEFGTTFAALAVPLIHFEGNERVRHCLKPSATRWTHRLSIDLPRLRGHGRGETVSGLNLR